MHGRGQRRIEGCIAGTIGRDEDGSKITLSFSISCSVGIAVGKNLKPVRARSIAIKGTCDNDACPRFYRAGQNRGVLEIIGSGVRVTDIICTYARGSEVDTQASIVIYRVSKYPVASRCGTEQVNAVAAIVGDDIPSTGRRPANRVVERRSLESDTVARIGESSRAR